MSVLVLRGAPLAAAQEPRLRRRLVAGFTLLWTIVLAHALLTWSGLSQTSDATLRASSLLYVATGAVAAALVWRRARGVESDRRAWGLICAAVCFSVLGNVLWDLFYFHLEDPPFPSAADLAWTLYFLPFYGAVAILMWARLRSMPRAVALDGIVSALGLAALVTGLLLDPILDATQGTPLTVLVNLVFPIGDAMLLALCVATFAMTRGRPGPAWLVLVAAIGAKAVADTTYVFQAAAGTYVTAGMLDVLWLLSLAGIAVAAWQTPQPSSDHTPGRGEHVVPALFSMAAVTLLGYGAVAGSLPVVAVALALATVVATAVRVTLVFRNVQNLSETRLLAESDELTGLLNRRGLSLRLEAALRDVHNGDLQALSLLLLDLNGFKEVNDTLGHHAGDRLLEEVARRLRTSLPDTTLARLGGDEFVVLLPCGPDAALAQAGRLRETLDRPVELEGLTTHTQASIGIACSPDHGGRRSDLLRHADVAMYRAKHRETGVELYAAEGDQNTRQRLAMAAELRVALQDPDQIHLHYQPQVDLLTGQVTSVEALVRWQHPRHGLLTPDRFLDLAEQHALMHDLTLAVLERALRQQRGWRRAGIELQVAVNVSAADLLDASFPAHVARELEAYGTPPSALLLELTEKTVMREPGRALDSLAQLSELGVSLSLDDFGTGYSSLAHLKRLPVQELKIDRSFVMDMLADRDDAIIVRSTVELGRSLGLRVVAEGVETVEQLERLSYFGCHVAQGYLFSRPLPAVKLPAWLDSHRPAAVCSRLRSDPGTAPGGARVLGPLLQVAGEIVAGAPLTDIFAAIGQQLQTVVPHDDLVVYRLQESDFTLAAVHAEGPSAQAMSLERFPAHEGVTGAALREGRMRNVARTDLDPDSVVVEGTETEPEALVCCPMTSGGHALGMVNVYRSGSWVPFSEDEAATIERFAAVASLALRRDLLTRA